MLVPIFTFGFPDQRHAGAIFALIRRANPFPLLNNYGTAAACLASALFYGPHSGFSLRANPETSTSDHNADTRRRRPLLNDPAMAGTWFLHDVVIGKDGGDAKSGDSDTGQYFSHWKSPSLGVDTLLLKKSRAA
ncbi:MAG: hypothetical protein WBW73_24035 [Rhodoplanes sp.]